MIRRSTSLNDSLQEYVGDVRTPGETEGFDCGKRVLLKRTFAWCKARDLLEKGIQYLEFLFVLISTVFAPFWRKLEPY